MDLADGFFMNKSAYERLNSLYDYEVIDKLIEKGLLFGCITDGSKGASVYTKDGVYHKDAYKVEVVDSTGAGDSFAGCFLHFLDKGLSIEKCLEYASYQGALACTRNGGMGGAGKEEELFSFMETL